MLDSMNFIIDPSDRCTAKLASTAESMVTLNSFLTAARDRIFARDKGVNHTVPNPG